MIYDLEFNGVFWLGEENSLEFREWDDSIGEIKACVFTRPDCGGFLIERVDFNSVKSREKFLLECEKWIPADIDEVNVDFEVVGDSTFVGWVKRGKIEELREKFGDGFVVVPREYIFLLAINFMVSANIIEEKAVAVDSIGSEILIGFFEGGIREIFSFKKEFADSDSFSLSIMKKVLPHHFNDEVSIYLPKYSLNSLFVRDFVKLFGNTKFFEDIDLFKNSVFNENRPLSYLLAIRGGVFGD
ncbi:MAG: hypothetical protein ACPLSJ_00820 [Thermosulfidibacteraceae bacterium]|jgi:hypothetical protein